MTPLDNAKTPFLKKLVRRSMRSRIDELEQRQVEPSATVGALSELSQDLGDQIAGRFLSPQTEDAEPTSSGFSGAFMSGAGEVFDEGTVKFGAVTNGELNFGVLDDGSVIANSVTFNGTELDARLTLDDFGNMTRQTGTEGSEVRVMKIGMESDGTKGVGYVNFYEPGADVTVPNGDFATNDLTSWTASGAEWGGTLGYARLEPNQTSKTLQNAARFAVTAGASYNFEFDMRFTSYVYTIAASIVVKFYDAITGGSLVSTETIYSDTSSDSSWVNYSKIIEIPATATHAYFLVTGTTQGQSWLNLDNFVVTALSVNTRLSFEDDGLYYLPDGGNKTNLTSTLYSLTNQTTISTSGETTVFSVVLPANFFLTNHLHYRLWVKTHSTTNRNFTERLTVGGTTVSIATVTGSTSRVHWVLEGYVSYSAEDVQNVMMESRRYNASSAAYINVMEYGEPANDDASTITVSLTLELSGAVTVGIFGGVIVERQ